VTGAGAAERRGRLVARVLAHAWRASPPPPPCVSVEELADIAPALLATGGAPLAWRRFRGGELGSSPTANELRQAHRHYALCEAASERYISQLFTLMRSRGVEPLLVKGWAAARLYPERGLRPYGDIDLVVAPPQLRAAEAALHDLSAPEAAVELHAGYAKLPDRAFEELIDRSELVYLNGLPVRVPGLEDHLRLLCLHMLVHGVRRPLWLCDIALALESRPAGFDWDRCAGGRPPYSDWVACALGLAHELLGAPLDGTPVAECIDRGPRWLAPAVLRQWGMSGDGIGFAPLAHAARRPAEFLKAAWQHWRNPIQATVELRVPFNGVPRLPVQLLATLNRCPAVVKQLLSSCEAASKGVIPSRPAGS
jgi:hypothetical protein